MTEMKTPAGTILPLLNLKGKPYLQVAHRLVWFREEHPDWGIQTKLEIDFKEQRCIAHAEILNSEGRVIASAHKVEDAKGFPDFSEKSETGAIGRALALCGYGTQFAPEIDEENRLVDSPTTPAKTQPQGNPMGPKGVPNPGQVIAFSSSPGEFIVPQGFGNNAGKKIKEIKPSQLEADVAYWQTRLKSKGEQPKATLKSYLDAIEAHLFSLKKEMGMDVNPQFPESDIPF